MVMQIQTCGQLKKYVIELNGYLQTYKLHFQTNVYYMTCNTFMNSVIGKPRNPLVEVIDSKK